MSYRARSLGYFLAASLLANLGVQVLGVVVGWEVYAQHGSALDLGWIGLAEFVPMFVLALPAGQLADRAPRRLVFAASLLVGAGVGVGLALVSGSGNTAEQITLTSAWKPGEPVWSGAVNGQPIAVQARPIPNGYILSWRGAFARTQVYTEREADYARLMPIKVAADTGKKLLCPMPGLVKSIAVIEGQEIKAGETLAVVEAMKMENVLRAERDGVVKAIHAKKGDSLAVDAVILEFA